MYDKFNEKLPKYWIVKCTEDNLKEFRETVITYIRNVYNISYMGNTGSHYGFDGNSIVGMNGIDWFKDTQSFQNSPTVLTLDEFKSYFEEFELPENWWVRVTNENKNILYEWRGVGKLFSADQIVGMVKWDDGRIEKGHNPLNKVKGRDYNFGKEITFEQFKKYVLKQEIIMKEIIGYKLKKEQYLASARSIMGCDPKYNKHPIDIVRPGNTDCDKLKEAGVLDLWFEPVYKEEDFKVGDWVVVLDKGTSVLRVGDIGKITCLGDNKFHPDFRVEARGITTVNWLEPKDVRLATPEEITKAQSKELYFGKVKFTIESGKDYAVTEYGKVPKKDIKKAIDWVKNAPSLAGFQFSIHNTKSGKYEKLTDISTGCIEDTRVGFGCRYGNLSELEAIYKAFD